MHNYPRSYEAAVGLLRRHKAQSIQIHDDLLLGYAWESVIVRFRETALIRWFDDSKTIIVTASREPRGATVEAIEYINALLPPGFKVRLNKSGRMMLHDPMGRSSVGNHQWIFLPVEPKFYDIF